MIICHKGKKKREKEKDLRCKIVQNALFNA